jgi:hypothetical protein
MWVHVGMKGGVDAGWVRKTLRFFFAGTLSKLRFFWYFIALPPYPVPKTYDGWVRREGQGGSDLGEKSFQLSSLLTL